MTKSDIDKLGELLYSLKIMSNWTINEKKIDLNLSGTYREIKQKYHELSKIFHPDSYDKNGISR